MEAEPKWPTLVLSLVMLVIFLFSTLLQRWLARKKEAAVEGSSVEPEPEEEREIVETVRRPAPAPIRAVPRPAAPARSRTRARTGYARLLAGNRWSPAAKLVVASAILERPRMWRLSPGRLASRRQRSAQVFPGP